MNLKNLKKAEKIFLKKYPGGFKHPDMLEIGKRHKIDSVTKLVKDSFSKDRFKDPDSICNSMTKLVTSSSMISLFEKPKFRDFIKSKSDKEKEAISNAIYQMLHGKLEIGFNDYLIELDRGKIAKWTLMSVLPFYNKVKTEVFVKPNTTKGIIKTLELDLVYKPRPSWDFYKKYRTTIKKMKAEVDPSLSPSNAAFTGFLMMSLLDNSK